MLAGGNPVRYPLPATAGFIPDPDDLARRITGRTKAVLVGSPTGIPTGAVFPLDVVQRIGTIAAQSGVYVVSDEIYEDIVFDDARHESFLSHAARPRLPRLRASKSYAMTGWRLGWVVCPEHAAPIAEKLREPVVSCSATPSQVAAEALASPQDTVERDGACFSAAATSSSTCSSPPEWWRAVHAAPFTDW